MPQKLLDSIVTAVLPTHNDISWTASQELLGRVRDVILGKQIILDYLNQEYYSCVDAAFVRW
jgi:hypothetical protein